ncbi:PepSY domain-containing protein [Puniceicoccaceae bacterium K14]|nr:PepSY domain-containing protein [Puniceicoccaceae bacterium K14]
MHKWLGIGTGVLFLITAMSGVLLLFYSELNLRGLHETDTSSSIIDYAPAIADMIDEHPGSRLVGIYVPAEKADRKTWQIFLKPADRDERIVGNLDPKTGEIISEHDYYSLAFGFLLKLHFSYFAATAGEIAAWIVSLALTLLSLSGLWIYRGAIKDLFRWRLSRKSSSRRTVTWLHKWTGLWSIALALIWGITGFLYMLVIAPRAFSPPPPPKPATESAQLRSLAEMPKIHAAAQAAFPERPTTFIRFGFPEGEDPQVRFRFLLREALPWHKFGEVIVNARTGEIAEVIQPHQRSTSGKYFATLATLHFGFYGGRMMQLIWAIGGIVMIFLPISGYIMWLRKRKRTRP